MAEEPKNEKDLGPKKLLGTGWGHLKWLLALAGVLLMLAFGESVLNCAKHPGECWTRLTQSQDFNPNRAGGLFEPLPPTRLGDQNAPPLPGITFEGSKGDGVRIEAASLRGVRHPPLCFWAGERTRFRLVGASPSKIYWIFDETEEVNTVLDPEYVYPFTSSGAKVGHSVPHRVDAFFRENGEYRTVTINICVENIDIAISIDDAGKPSIRADPPVATDVKPSPIQIVALEEGRFTPVTSHMVAARWDAEKSAALERFLAERGFFSAGRSETMFDVQLRAIVLTKSGEPVEIIKPVIYRDFARVLPRPR